METDGLKEWLSVRAIAVGDDEYFAGLEHGGVWRAPRASGAVEPPLRRDGSPTFSVEPNPFNEGARISFRLDGEAVVELEAYDASGRRVASLASGKMPAGVHEVRWDGSGDGSTRVSAGVYFIKLRVGDEERTAKQLLVK